MSLRSRSVKKGRPRSGSGLTLSFLIALLVICPLILTPVAVAAATFVPLGTASSFAVLAGSTVTNTGPTVVTGDLGVSPGSAVTGFPPGIVLGTIHAADAVALQAQNDLTTAYNNAASQGPTSPIVADLGGQTLVAGVYNSASSIGLTGTLTLNAEGNPNAVFVFQAGSTLTTASGSQVNLINGAQSCNVFWQVGSSATLGTGSTFRGTILALTSITVTTGVIVDGRVLARNGAVTLDTNTITKTSCVDTTRPTCPITATILGPPKAIQVTVQDTGSGLASIQVTSSTNTSVGIPGFGVGTTAPVVVTATKINQSLSSSFTLRVTDVAGNVTICDPVLHVAVRDEGKPVAETFTGVPQAESKVMIHNGSPGVKNLELNVNGTTFKVTGLKDDAIVNLDISSAMRAGNDNTITVTAHGKPGASAFVVISD